MWPKRSKKSLIAKVGDKVIITIVGEVTEIAGEYIYIATDGFLEEEHAINTDHMEGFDKDGV